MPPRGGARPAARNKGPDLSFEDEDYDRPPSPPSNIPGPLFPERPLRKPKPPTQAELQAVQNQISYRSRCRSGPLFCTLDQTSIHDDHGKANKKAGFDVFTGQDRWSTRKVVKTRTLPDLGSSGRGEYGYSLQLYPQELWGLLDPEQRNPLWKTVREDSVAYASLGRKTVKPRDKERRRKKRKVELVDAMDVDEQPGSATDSDEDPVSGAANRKRQKDAEKHRRNDEARRPEKEKGGLDAEDDIGAENAEPGSGSDEEEGDQEDDEFEDDSDGGGDYDAEQYFDGGEDDLDDEGGGAGDDY